MAAASIIMTISLSFGVGTLIYLLNPKNSSTISPTVSKLRTYCVQVTSMTYRWHLVAASFDRYVITSANQRLRRLASMHIVRRIILINSITWIILPVHNLIYNTANFNSNDFIYNEALLYYHSIFTAMAGCILPGSIMITFSVLIYRNLILKLRRRAAMIILHRAAVNEIAEQKRKHERQVLLLLIVQVVACVITIIPFVIMYFYNAATFKIKYKSAERVAAEKFATYLSSLSVYLFPTLSFYLYTMTSSTFREELTNLMRLIFRRRTRIEPIVRDTHPAEVERH